MDNITNNLLNIILPIDNCMVLYKLDKNKFPISTREKYLLIIFQEGCELPTVRDTKPKKYFKFKKQFIKLHYN